MSDVQYYPDFTTQLEYEGKTGKDAVDKILEDLKILEGEFSYKKTGEHKVWHDKPPVKIKKGALILRKLFECADGTTKPVLEGVEFLEYKSWQCRAAMAHLLGYEIRDHEKEVTLDMPLERLDGFPEFSKVLQVLFFKRSGDIFAGRKTEFSDSDRKVQNILKCAGEVSNRSKKYYSSRAEELLRIWKVNYTKEKFSLTYNCIQFGKEQTLNEYVTNISELYSEYIAPEKLKQDKSKGCLSLEKKKVLYSSLMNKQFITGELSEQWQWKAQDAQLAYLAKQLKVKRILGSSCHSELAKYIKRKSTAKKSLSEVGNPALKNRESIDSVVKEVCKKTR